MSTIEHKLLGTIDPSTPDVWDGELLFSGRAVTVDLTIDESDLSTSALENTLKLGDDLSTLDKKARAALYEDPESGPDAATTLYFQHHVEQLSEGALTELLGTADRSKITREEFFSHLHLVRVGMYPEHTDSTLLLDYSIGVESTDYLLCVAFDANGDVTAIDMES